MIRHPGFEEGRSGEELSKEVMIARIVRIVGTGQANGRDVNVVSRGSFAALVSRM